MMEKGEIWKLGESGLYRVVGDYSAVETPLDYDLENIQNESDTLTVSEQQVEPNVNSGKWQKVKL